MFDLLNLKELIRYSGRRGGPVLLPYSHTSRVNQGDGSVLDPTYRPERRAHPQGQNENEKFSPQTETTTVPLVDDDVQSVVFSTHRTGCGQFTAVYC